MSKNPIIKIEQMVGWEWAKKLILRTQNKKPKTPFPTSKQKLEWLLAEHSPIKVVEWCIDIDNLRQWVGVHLLRHPFVLPFISSQRSDRVEDKEAQIEMVLSYIKEDIINDPLFDKKEWRDYRLQGSTNNHSFVVNAQTLINISKKRLCHQASKETRDVWLLVHDCIKEQDKEMAAAMVPTCIYRGFCPEITCCGYVLSNKYKEELNKYHNLISSPQDRFEKYKNINK